MWLLKLIGMLVFLGVILPFSVMLLGFVLWWLAFMPLAVFLVLVWNYEGRRLREREAAPEMLTDERRARALEYWVKKHQNRNPEKEEDKP